VSTSGYPNAFVLHDDFVVLRIERQRTLGTSATEVTRASTARLSPTLLLNDIVHFLPT
jgi:hypothetical protein